MDSDEDSLFVSNSSLQKIKSEPGSNTSNPNISFSFPEENFSKDISHQTGIEIHKDSTKSRTEINNKEISISKLQLKTSKVKALKTAKKSTSEILNALYEEEHAIALESTPQLVLDDSNDDEIVQEFPVFYSTKFLERLYLLQYPTRSAARPLVDSLGTGILDSRIKPLSQAVEIDIPIDSSKFYDREKGESWGGLDKQTFSGIAKQVQGYMIGVFKDNELHLNPIYATAQLRPQFSQISQPSGTTNDISERSSVSLEKEKGKHQQRNKVPKAVQLTAKIVGENAPSFSGALTARKKMEDESYVGMDWYDRDSDESWAISEGLVATSKGPLISTVSQDRYIENISSPHLDPIGNMAIVSTTLNSKI